MHAGMVPICTKEASVDLENFGIRINNRSVDDVRAACKKFSTLPSEEVQMRARESHKYVNRVHTREQFSKYYEEFAKKILDIKKYEFKSS
jgi:hypothetical protein